MSRKSSANTKDEEVIPLGTPKTLIVPSLGAESRTMQRWRAVKKGNPNALVLVEIGVFMELFGDDAKLMNALLDMPLMKQERYGIAHTGFPTSAIRFYSQLFRENRLEAVIIPAEKPSL